MKARIMEKVKTIARALSDDPKVKSLIAMKCETDDEKRLMCMIIAATYMVTNFDNVSKFIQGEGKTNTI